MTDPENQEVQQNQQEAPTENSNALKLGQESQVGYVGVLVSAVILLVSLTTNDGLFKNHKYYEYGIAVSVVAMFISICAFAMVHFKLGSDNVSLGVNGLLFVWCFVGACFMTFGGPFKLTGNGYFGAWGMLLFSLLTVGVKQDEVAEASKGLGALGGLLASAIILLTALISEEFKDNDKAEMIYGTIVACLTILVVGGLLYLQKTTGKPHSAQLVVMGCFACMWIVAAGLLTFNGPFVFTGNGYFSAWGGAVTAVFATMAARASG